LKKEKARRIGFEEYHITVFNFNKLKTKLKKFKLIPVSDIIEKLRAIKDGKEIKCIKKALKISLIALNDVLKLVKPGIEKKTWL